MGLRRRPTARRRESSSSRSAAAKEKLLDCVSPGNFEKTRSAPVTAIIGTDFAFYEKLPFLFPHADAKSWFAGKQEFVETTAFRNSSLQGGYFILAARAVGLDHLAGL